MEIKAQNIHKNALKMIVRLDALGVLWCTDLTRLSRRPRWSEQVILSDHMMLAALGGRLRGCTRLQATWSRTPGKQDLSKHSVIERCYY